MPEEKCTILKSAEELNELPDDSTDIFQNGIIECYNNRQSKVDQLCLTQFASYYYKNTFGENHYQPTQLAGNVTDEFLCKLPKIIKLETVRGTMVRRKSKVVF